MNDQKLYSFELSYVLEILKQRKIDYAGYKFYSKSSTDKKLYDAHIQEIWFCVKLLEDTLFYSKQYQLLIDRFHNTEKNDNNRLTRIRNLSILYK